jgi:TonB family protein
MMRERFALISLTLAAAYAVAQTPQPVPAAPAAAPTATATTSANDDLTIHYKGAGVTAPEFLSINGTFDAIDHCKKLDGEEQILIAVDRAGTPQTIMLLKVLGNDLDEMAQHVVELDKFKPGTADGAPSIVAVAVKMDLQACRMEKTNEQGRKRDYVQLRSAPKQVFELVEAPRYALTELPPAPGSAAWNKLHQGLYRIGGGITAPIILHQVDPAFSDEARKAKYQGVCLISIIVDVNGNPQNPRIVRPLGMGLDMKAIEAVKQFRFRPAMKGKTPVPVQITVEVNFRLY